MSTIALALHEPAAGRVRDIWAHLGAQFGLAGIRRVPFPHLTLLGFEGLDHDRAKEVLERFSQETAPFALEAHGLGLFHGPSPILYAPVVKTPTLEALHRSLAAAFQALGAQTYPLYEPDRWIPHITLAQGAPARGTYGEAVDLLLGMDLHIPFEVRNLTLFQWIGPRYEPADRFPLMGPLCDVQNNPGA